MKGKQNVMALFEFLNYVYPIKDPILWSSLCAKYFSILSKKRKPMKIVGFIDKYHYYLIYLIKIQIN